jgi:hypothetical protein
LNAIHIANNDGVTFKTCTAEVFRPAPTPENLKFSTAETRKDSAVHVSLSSSSLVKQPGSEDPTSAAGSHGEASTRRQMTTDDDRLLIHSSS